MTSAHDLFISHVQKLSAPSSTGQVTGKCPFHDDSTASWSGNVDSGVWHCFACDARGNERAFAVRIGQATEKVSKPVHVKTSAGETGKAGEVWNARGPDVTYDYTDISGEKLLYQIGRFAGKDGKKFFLPRVPHGEGDWTYSLEDIPRVLYRLPEIKPARQVFYVEGEKCVEALRSIGKVATTHAGGVNGTLSPAMLAPLREKHVVILPDNDDPGRILAGRLREVLTKIAAIVSVVELPGLGPKGDVADWLAAGFTEHDLTAQVQASAIVGGLRPWTPTLRIFSTITRKEIQWLFYPYIPLGRVTLLEGNPGIGKSWFCAALAGAVSLGHMPVSIIGGHNLSFPAGAIYMNLEDDPEDTTKVRLDAVAANQDLIATLSGKQGTDGKVLPLTLSDLDIFARAIESMNAKVLMIDPIQAYLPSGREMNRAEHVRPLMQELQRLGKEYQCAIVLVRHLAKGNGKDNVLYRGMGSVDFTAAARSVLQFSDCLPPRVGKEEVGARRVGVVQVKNNLAPRGPVLEFETRLNEFRWGGVGNISHEAALTPLSQSASQEVRDAQMFVDELLRDGTCPILVMEKKAKAAGLSPSSVELARMMMGIIRKTSPDGVWAWTFPGGKEREMYH